MTPTEILVSIESLYSRTNKQSKWTIVFVYIKPKNYFLIFASESIMHKLIMTNFYDKQLTLKSTGTISNLIEIKSKNIKLLFPDQLKASRCFQHMSQSVNNNTKNKRRKRNSIIIQPMIDIKSHIVPLVDILKYLEQVYYAQYQQNYRWIYIIDKDEFLLYSSLEQIGIDLIPKFITLSMIHFIKTKINGKYKLTDSVIIPKNNPRQVDIDYDLFPSIIFSSTYFANYFQQLIISTIKMNF